MNEFRKEINERVTLSLVKSLFREKCKKLNVKADLDLEILDRQPVVGENVYGEAFPEEKRVKLEVYPEATREVCVMSSSTSSTPTSSNMMRRDMRGRSIGKRLRSV